MGGARRGLAVGTAALALAACSGSSSPDRAALPTVVSGASLCNGLLATASVDAAIGTTKYSVFGGVSALPPNTPRNGDGTTFLSAACHVAVSEGDAVVVSADLVGENPADDRLVVDGAHDTAPSVPLPASFGVGYGRPVGTQVGGTSVTTGQAAVLRGDWRVVVVVGVPARGRDAAADAVALLHQVVARLEIPLNPSTPYPTPS